MKNLKKLSVIITLLTTVMLVVSCGGGGGGGGTAPSGSGSMTLDPVTKVISGSFTTANVVNATLAHIHDGNVGVQGNIIVPLQQASPGSATWVVPANSVLTDPQIARLQAGGYYVNVHTALNPGGEIRGQLIPDSATANKFNASLNLAQEVPTPITPVY